MPAAPPRIAVVIPCYNSEAWIGRAIGSVLEQAHENLCLIVVDDGSTDGSAARVRAFGDRVILQGGPNHGACHARNQGLAIARQQRATHILFLDADDYLEGDMLAGAARVAAETGADMVLSDMHIDDFDGSRRKRRLYSGRIDPVTLFKGWLRQDFFIPAAILWRIDLVEEIGGWDESLSRKQDTDIVLRALFETPLIQKNDQGAAIYSRVNPGSISRSLSPAATDSQLRVITGLLHRAPGTAFAPLIPQLNETLYAITRTAFRLKQTDIGRQGLRELAAQGYRNHPGNWPHRLLAHLIGLENKVRFIGR